MTPAPFRALGFLAFLGVIWAMNNGHLMALVCFAAGSLACAGMALHLERRA